MLQPIFYGTTTHIAPSQVLLAQVSPCMDFPDLPPTTAVQVLALRQEKAELLGFNNFAEVSMASKVRLHVRLE